VCERERVRESSREREGERERAREKEREMEGGRSWWSGPPNTPMRCELCAAVIDPNMQSDRGPPRPLLERATTTCREQRSAPACPPRQPCSSLGARVACVASSEWAGNCRCSAVTYHRSGGKSTSSRSQVEVELKKLKKRSLAAWLINGTAALIFDI
jgi:hypothetical protein